MARNNLILPELLAPAGSPLSLRAAIDGGADAVYMGGSSFNARINAKNFDENELREGIELAHTYGVKVYITANTLIFDREREDFLRAAEKMYLFGADALIVADIGMAKEIKKRIPIELHASTQLSGHNVAAAQLLSDAGFSRMVCAREMSKDDLRTFCKSSPIEAEVFVHGALCVCASGQCLFSSIVGGRSGNRGECAQPCRLPYSASKGKQEYPLSLRDLSLARHVSELCDMGVSSFKIEGRMKSPEYVRDVTQIWRCLLDGRRNATDGEMRELTDIFSRGGLTDGYYEKSVGRNMLGVRSRSDKDRTAELSAFKEMTRKLPLELYAKIKSGEPIELLAKSENTSAVAYGPVPEAAINAPTSKENAQRSLSKLGGTPYNLKKIDIELDEGLMVPVSVLNTLRREAINSLAPKSERSESGIHRLPLDAPKKPRMRSKTALFYNAEAIPDEAFSFFDTIYVPLEQYRQGLGSKVGVMLPEIIYDSELKAVSEMLEQARETGASKALVGNLGHAELARQAGFEIHGDLRLNVTNASSARRVEELGFEDVILSPELTLAQMRDIKGRT
ncbi:MAG: U32 family peptidase, partial [Clostridia bacterium]|nr:U32 family peptidase [Clostridia bacterium]